MKFLMRKWRNDFKNSSNSEFYYDLFDDWSLIESSIATQYPFRLRAVIKEMKWGELSAYISGLMSETPLGNTVQIRSETDAEIIKKMTPEQKEIRANWRNKQAKNVSEDEMKAFLEQMKTALIKMAGGKKDA